MTGPATERKTHSEEQAKRVLLGALRRQPGPLTKADAVALSGLPVPDAEQALTGLLKEYRSHLAATESGELVYEFDPAFARRDAVPLGEKLAKVGRALWKGFTFLFKISIVTTLAVYFLVFLAMMLALIFGRRSDDRDRGGGLDLGWPLFWMWGWGPSGHDPYGRRASPRRRGKPLYKKVFEFVFGPPRPREDPLLDEKEILAHIRKHRGRIAAVDLVLLMGWDFPRAEEEATRLLIDYGGEPEVTDDGVVLYVFKDIRKTAQEKSARRRAAAEGLGAYGDPAPAVRQQHRHQRGHLPVQWLQPAGAILDRSRLRGAPAGAPGPRIPPLYLPGALLVDDLRRTARPVAGGKGARPRPARAQRPACPAACRLRKPRRRPAASRACPRSTRGQGARSLARRCWAATWSPSQTASFATPSRGSRRSWTPRRARASRRPVPRRTPAPSCSRRRIARSAQRQLLLRRRLHRRASGRATLASIRSEPISDL